MGPNTLIKMKILTLILILNFFITGMALIREDDPRLFYKDYKEQELRDDEGIPYPVDVDPNWNDESRTEFIKFIKKTNCQGCKPGSGGKPLSSASGVVGSYDYRALQKLFRAKTCPPLYACKNPYNANSCCTFQIIYGRHYCDYRTCES